MGKGAICLRAFRKKEGSGRRRTVFELLEVAVFNLLHEGAALEEVALEIAGELAGNDEELVVGNFGERDGAAGWNEMCAPLEDEASVPESEDGEKSASSGEGGAAGAEELSGAIEKNGEAENEKRSERNEKAVAVGRDASPIGVTGHENVKGEEGGEERGADKRFAEPEEEESDDGEKKNGRPGKQAVIGREEHVEEGGREPEPVPERDIAGFESASVNEIAREESGQQADEDNGGEEQVAEEKFRNARNCGGPGLGMTAKRGEILAEGFDRENGEDYGVGVVNIEHEAGDRGENQPLREGTRGARLVPTPEEEGHGEGGMRMGPRGIEIHIDRERTSPPDGERGKERPAFLYILPRQAEGQEQTEKTIGGSSERHGDSVRSGKTVCGDGGTEGARQKDAHMREEEKRRPENCGANGEMVVEVAGGRS